MLHASSCKPNLLESYRPHFCLRLPAFFTLIFGRLFLVKQTKSTLHKMHYAFD